MRCTRSSAHLQFGQVLLASIGSTAPFIGLFGTVWGIYHALVSISAAGSITIEKVSGPVGEALIMTAAGLAVAIPAVLAYNVFGKWVAACEAELEGFAHDLREMVARRGQHAAGGPSLTWPSAASSARPAQPMSDINMTPLIDVMLVLLVIFMITAPLMTSSLKLDLPQDRRGQAHRRAAVRRAWRSTREGRIFFGDERSTPAALRRACARPRSATRRPRCSCAPTADVPYGRVAELIGVVQKAG